jgi:hypothetical protein
MLSGRLKYIIKKDFSVQNQVVYSNLPPPLDGQIQTAVSLLVYKASLVRTAVTGQPRYDNRGRTAMIRQLGQDSLNRSARNISLGRIERTE